MFVRTAVIGFVLSLSSLASAQQSLTGVVRDGSGAVVPGTTVVIRQDGKAFERVVDTGRDGRFTVSPIDAGQYSIEAIAAGFAVATATAVVPASQPIEIALTPAAVVEAVQIVSASRQDELRESLNTNVNVISRRQIEESGSQTVAELLREVPGMMSRRGSETAGAAGEQIQGIDSRQVLVLLDGQPLVGGRGIKRGVINLDRQSVGRLEQIEVVKGASSALYGSDAIGGVINIITREATAPFDTAGELSGGSLGEVNASAGAGFRRDRVSGLFSVEHHQQDGFDLTPTTFDTTGAPFTRADFMARARVKASDVVSVGALVNGYDNNTKGRSNGELGPQEDNIDDRTLNVNVNADWLPRASTSVQARAYAGRYHERSSARLAPPASTQLEPGALDERLLKVDGSFSQILGSAQQLQGGAEYWRDEYSGINRLRNDAGERASISTAWLQHRLTIAGRVTTTLGVRTDQHSEFGGAVSPKIAANARLGAGVSVRASYGRGFRAPDIGQLYYRFLNPSSIYQVIGNLNLQPEYANSLQVGGEYATPGRRARLGVNLFRNDVRDLIESVNLGFAATPAQVTQIMQREGLDMSFRPVAGRLLLTYKNINNAVTEGVEFDGELAATSNLSVAGAYTYLDARDDLSGLPLTGRNTHTGTVRATWRQPRIGLVANVRGMFVGQWIAARATVNGQPQDTYAKGYGLWDAYVSQRIVGGLSGFVAIDNLTDGQDANVGKVSATGAPLAIYRPDVGRTARFGMRWSWAK
ncbi:MAG TPA: TonB-dependent receptor [Vicinamibacterales bacterium]|nr:TonB-dependent receptor [Vicinamibacterales bacterium]